MDSGFFNNTEVVSEDFATFVRGILTNGVTGDTEDVLKVTAAGGMKISVAPGYAWINGHYGVCESSETLTIATADGVNPRIDRVVVRLDMSAAKVSLAIVTGIAATSPSATALTRDGTIHELCLAEVRVNAGVTSISNENIKDTRADSKLCGAVLANTRETLTLDGKADESDLQAVENRMTTAENNINTIANKLNSKVLQGKNLISTPKSGTDNVIIEADTVGFCPIRIGLTVNVTFKISASGYEISGEKSLQMMLFGEETLTTRIRLTDEGSSEDYYTDVRVETTANNIKVTSTPIQDPESVGTFTRNSITINSMRGAYLP